jgi:alpha-beta hydrolase superfamily lysophospholipase
MRPRLILRREIKSMTALTTMTTIRRRTRTAFALTICLWFAISAGWAFTPGALAGRALAAGCDLKPRGFAGFAYRDLTGADADSLKHGDTRGITVSQVVPGSPAERAGLKAGDVITGYDGHPILDSSGLASVVRHYFAGDTVSVLLVRGGRPITQPLALGSYPLEASSEVETEYTCFETNGIKLRAVVTSPPGGGKARLPALLLVSALGSPRLVGTPGYSMGREIAHAVTGIGFRVLRFELRGSGDSEGEDYRETDFTTEVNDNLAAFDYLASREDVDPARVFVMGHSTGGMIAAIVASRRETAGLVTSCTIGRTFYERSLETLRLQSEFAGDTPQVTDTKLKGYLDLMTAAARGDSLAEILRRNPALAEHVNSNNRIMDDRNPAYWREQLNLNLPEVYAGVTEPVLIVYAASDFLTQLACHEAIRDVLAAAGNRDVTLAVIPETGHGYTYARDKREAFDTYRKSDRKPNPEPLLRIAEWLEARKGSRESHE